VICGSCSGGRFTICDAKYEEYLNLYKLKKIIRFQKRRPQWDLEKLYTQKQTVQDTLERKLSAIECDSGNVEVQPNNI
jgi:hypothetical protein